MSLIIRQSVFLLKTYPALSKCFLDRTRRSAPIAGRHFIHTGIQRSKEDANKSKQVVVHSFDAVENKDKQTFLDVLHIYVNRDVHRRGHVEFIYAAMKHMEEFGVHKDLQVYKGLLDVLPKGKFIPTNVIQAEFMHYPKQQQCAIDLLEKMEDNGVIPDWEMQDMLLNIFGKRGYPLRKFWRMMYWMPKFKNLSPWLLPNPVPDDALELAKLAMARISSVDLQSKVCVYQADDIEDSLDKTWIVSAMSPVQQELLDNHPHNVPIYVEGSFKIWLRGASVDYFILRADPKKRKERTVIDTDDVGDIRIPFWDSESSDLVIPSTVHEQDDGTIFAVCATGTSSRDSLLSWIRSLESENPILAKIPVLFTLKGPLGDVVPLDVAPEESMNADDEKRIENK